MGVAFIYFTESYASPAVIGNSQGAPSPAKRIHPENFTENVEESVSHHVHIRRALNDHNAAAECSPVCDLPENQKNSATFQHGLSV